MHPSQKSDAGKEGTVWKGERYANTSSRLLQADYFAAYRSLKLTRNADGVLVVEFHSNGGPFIFTAQDHTEVVDAFYRISQDRAWGRAFRLSAKPFALSIPLI